MRKKYLRGKIIITFTLANLPFILFISSGIVFLVTSAMLAEISARADVLATAANIFVEFIKQMGWLRITTISLLLGFIGLFTWILSNEILSEKDLSKNERSSAMYSKVVGIIFTVILSVINILFLISTFIAFWGVTLFRLDFGNMRFYEENSILLIIFYFIIPALIVFYWFVFKKKSALLSWFANSELLQKLIATTNRKMQILKATLLLVVIFYFIVGWARPQLGTKLETVKRQGVDIMIALDVSLSMLAEDIAPNRLEKAKHEIENLINKLEGDRVGLIAFAGVPFIQCPLTLDYGAAKIFLDVMEPDLIPDAGTAIGSAIQTAIKAFEQTERKHKVLVLITDGEEHEGEPLKAAEEAEKQGIVIYTVGIGSPEGVPIPITDDRSAGRSFKKDREGKVVMTKLDEITLEKIALQTSGKYFRASSSEVELDKIYEDISKMEKKELASKKFSQYEDRFQYILVFALFLLIAEVFIPDRKRMQKA